MCCGRFGGHSPTSPESGVAALHTLAEGGPDDLSGRSGRTGAPVGC